MRVSNLQFRIPRPTGASWDDVATEVQRRVSGDVLRWAVVSTTERELVVEATAVSEALLPRREPPPSSAPTGRFVVAHLVPTGIGCAIGGFAGDAGPVTALLAGASDLLLTNPNAVNASDFLGLPAGVLYTEGYSLDAFCAGEIELQVPTANRVGLVIESGPREHVDRILNVVNAVRAVHGLPLEDIVITAGPIGSRCVRSASGAFVGTIDHPEILLEAAQSLVDRGVSAIAITTDIRDIPDHVHARHFRGEQPNPMGGVEAVISHLVSRRFGLPAAHAPMVNRPPGKLDGVVDPRGAGEYVSRTGLACTILGLWRAPQLGSRTGVPIDEVVCPADLRAIVLPASALGNLPVLSSRARRVPVIAVRENRTILDVDATALHLDDVLEVENYLEAAGALLALSEGLSLSSLRRPLASVRPVRLRSSALVATNGDRR